MENAQYIVMKENVHLMSIIGYFFSDLCGLFVALLVYGLTKEIGMAPILSALTAWGSAAAVAGVLLSVIWLAAREPEAVKAKMLKV